MDEILGIGYDKSKVLIHFGITVNKKVRRKKCLTFNFYYA